ncbi:MAG: PQQ-binding-like beta-propeller repeat protein [Gammaproteobacteria bacterium]|nr:PQQ-binding-like beta-propeller repeat protein [Gammaproteobacteria bacterium]
MTRTNCKLILLALTALLVIPATAQNGSSSQLLNAYQPIDQQMLLSPPAQDWLMWRNRYDLSGYSSLEQVNRDNVNQLTEAWRTPLSHGGNMTTPLVHDGVMFIADTNNILLALDARNGTELWRYQHESDNFDGRRQGIALFGDRVFVPHNDLDLVVLNVRTGAIEWTSKIETPVQNAQRGYYALRGAPMIADGMVIQGVTATILPQGGFIVGLDAETGVERWRFHTVAHPGEPGGNSWNNLPLEQRSGGSVWNSGSYDAELNLVYFGAAPTYDTAPLLDDLGIEGVNNDALFTNTTMALRPRTGELVWFFQHMPNDQLDLDWVYERQLDELEIDGKLRKVVFTAGKMALYDVVDAATGEYLDSIDLGVQNVISDIDPESGHKAVNPDSLPNIENNHLVCPYFLGGRNWQAGSYNPDTKMLYLPVLEMCMMAGLIADGTLLSTGIEATPAPRADSDGQFGRLQAINMETRELAWQHRELTPPSTPLLATGGGLVFGGNLDRSFKAYDSSTGEVLWQTALGHLPASFPITYEIDGRQYIAIIQGQPSRFTGSLFGIITGFLGADNPAVQPPTDDPALVVFALD